LPNNNWKDIAELIGLAAIVASLILVAFEVRQATFQAQAEASSDVVFELQSSIKELAVSPDLSEIFVRATTEGVSSLTAVEKFRVSQWERARRFRMISVIDQFERGFVDREQIMAMLPSLSRAESGLWDELEIIEPVRQEMGLLDQ
jgi:hypothetical protein